MNLRMTLVLSNGDIAAIPRPAILIKLFSSIDCEVRVNINSLSLYNIVQGHWISHSVLLNSWIADE